jgi:PIN domain nuclease of toxin-antitoxin system
VARYVFVSTIVLAEITRLEEKRRTTIGFEEVVAILAAKPTIQLFPVDLAVVSRSRLLRALPDLHDRFIVATALILDAEVVTADRLITDLSLVPIVW